MKKAIINSLPKSGTNLLAKCLNLFGYKEQGHISAGTVLDSTIYAKIKNLMWETNSDYYVVGINTPTKIRKTAVNSKFKKIKQNQFISSHVGYNDEILEAALNYDLQPIQVVRDPRAVLASFVPYICSDKSHFLHSSFSSLSKNEQYKVVLEGYSDNKHELQPLYDCCNALTPWLNSKKVITIRFEDIVGATGGGSDEKQRETLALLIDKLEVQQTLLDPTIRNLYGPGRHTFRKGQIDSWRDEIPKDLIDNINAELEEVLLKWGYTE